MPMDLFRRALPVAQLAQPGTDAFYLATVLDADGDSHLSLDEAEHWCVRPGNEHVGAGVDTFNRLRAALLGDQFERRVPLTQIAAPGTMGYTLGSGLAAPDGTLSYRDTTEWEAQGGMPSLTIVGIRRKLAGG